MSKMAARILSRSSFICRLFVDVDGIAKQRGFRRLSSQRWGFRRKAFQSQMTLSLPPSIGTCAPVVLEKLGPHNSAMTSPTSRLVISVLRILFVLYSWTEIP